MDPVNNDQSNSGYFGHTTECVGPAAIPIEGVAAASDLKSPSVIEQQTAMLGQLIKTPAGREMLAKSLGPSLRRRKDFVGFSGAPTIHKQTSTYVRYRDKFDLFATDDEGWQVIHLKNYRDDATGTIRSYRIPVPVFSICSNPMIPLDTIRAKQFDLVARCLNMAKAEIGGCEDGYILALWDAGAQAANVGKIDGNKDIEWSDGVFKRAKEVFAKRSLSMKACFVNPRTGGVEIEKWELDSRPIDNKDRWRGILGWKDDVEFRQTRKVDPGFAYFTAERTGTAGGRNDMGLARYTKDVYAAYIIEEQELRVATADRLDLEQIGFNLSEEVGFAANPIAVQRVAFDETYVRDKREIAVPWEDDNWQPAE
jgi:hypothetical protein